MKKILLCFSLIFNLLLVGQYCVAQNQPHTAKVKKQTIDESIREEMAKRHIAGMSVAVLQSGKVVLMKSYGLANIEQSIPAAPKTKYQIASTTKPFTALAVMMLVESGKISLDEKAAKYLSGLPAQYSEVTVQQLLTHTSGVNRDLRTDNADDFTAAEFWKRLAAAPVSFKPGERWEYSNTGYILLGMIIESAAKKTYSEFLNERIFKPLGMTDTEYLEMPGRSKNRAIGYDWVENTFRPSPYFSGGFGAGGLISTVSDLAKWDVALNSEKLIKRSNLEQMWMPAKLSDGKTVNFDFRGQQSSYGFGWFLTVYRGRKIVTHGGTVSGFSSQIIRFTDDKITIIVNSNGKSGADRIGYAEYLAKSVADFYVPNLLPESANR
ncbi:MAG TPA: serine hydrolase domain-containing protein [Pyrinomonadaceae bacterium]|nr:serine hydrolase domain-containing protein [Pyrinomonadaceae bacterium]